LLWDGETRGFHRIRDTILKAPDDVIQVEWQRRQSHKGEVDICINFKLDGDIPPGMLEALRATTYAVTSLINLAIQDFLVPTAPFQLRQVMPGGGDQMESTLLLAIHDRKTITPPEVQTTLSHVANALKSPAFGPKLVTALELYAAHFTESQARVRFLLLVIAMEALSSGTKKHDAAIQVLRRWEADLEAEMRKHPQSSEAWLSLDALRRELGFRSDDSIRTQVRKLFAGIPGVSPEDSVLLQRRALQVYDKRSTLVHDGQLPASELAELEREARDLLERVLRSAMERGS
jgi:hypothetical protein